MSDLPPLAIAVALAAALARRRPDIAPVARVLAAWLLADLYLYIAQPWLLTQPMPHHGLARLAFHVEWAAILAWPAGRVALAVAAWGPLCCAPRSPAQEVGAGTAAKIGRRSPAAKLGAVCFSWALTSAAFALAYPALRGAALPLVQAVALAMALAVTLRGLWVATTARDVVGDAGRDSGSIPGAGFGRCRPRAGHGVSVRVIAVIVLCEAAAQLAGPYVAGHVIADWRLSLAPTVLSYVACCVVLAMA